MAQNTLFLGQQLAEQSAKLSELVTKMTEMLIKQDASIEKFAKASDEVQQEFKSPTNEYDQQLTSNMGMLYKVYFEGSLRFEIDVKNTSSSYSYGFKIYKNGVEIWDQGLGMSASFQLSIDIPVNEKDEIKIDPSNYLYLKYKLMQFKYTLVNKPDAIIEDL